MIRRPASLHAVRRCCGVPALPRYYQGAATSRRPSRLAPFPSLGGTAGASAVRSPRPRTRGRRAWACCGSAGPGRSSVRRRRQELPSSWGTPIAPSPCSGDPGRTPGVRPLRRRGAAPAMRTTRAPALGLSGLNHTALALAVYASPGRLPAEGARLASGRWSGFAGRASHPQGPDERFPCAFLTSLPPLPSFAWRNLFSVLGVVRLLNPSLD